jgi:hypothetical protein
VSKGLNPRADPGLVQNAMRHFEIKLKSGMSKYSHSSNLKAGWFNPDLDKLLPPGASFTLELTLHAPNESMTPAKKSFAMLAHSVQTLDRFHAPGSLAITGDTFLYGTGGGTLATTDVIIVDGTEYQAKANAADGKIQLGSAVADAALATPQPAGTVQGDGAFTFMYTGNVVAAPILNYTVTNATLRIPSVKIEDPAFLSRMNMLRARGYVWTASTYKRYVSSVSNALGEEIVQVPDRSYSLDAIIAILRESRAVNDPSKYGNSIRSLNGVSGWQAQIGSQLYPPAKINYAGGSNPGAGGRLLPGHRAISNTRAGKNFSEAWCETKRIFGYDKGIVTPEQFAQSELNEGAGVMCINTQSYKHDKSVLSGLDTKSQPLPISFSFTKVSNPVIGADANEAFGTNLTGRLDLYAKCSIQFSMAADTGVMTSST